jgi:hypothetical protein
MTNYYTNIFKKIENCKPDNYMKIMTQTSTHLEFVSKIFGKICQKITSVYFFKSMFYLKYRVREWLLLNANSAIFQLYHVEYKLIFNEMHFVLD